MLWSLESLCSKGKKEWERWALSDRAAQLAQYLLCHIDPHTFLLIFLFKHLQSVFIYWLVKMILQMELIRLAASRNGGSTSHSQPALLCHWKQGQGDRESNWCSARPPRSPWDVTAASLSTPSRPTQRRLRLTSLGCLTERTELLLLMCLTVTVISV